MATPPMLILHWSSSSQFTSIKFLWTTNLVCVNANLLPVKQSHKLTNTNTNTHTHSHRCLYSQHARVWLCFFKKIRRKRRRERGRTPPVFIELTFSRLNNSAVTEWRGGRGTRWCHDSHCQTTETDTHFERVCLCVLKGFYLRACEFACECFCLWMCICILQRLFK